MTQKGTPTNMTISGAISHVFKHYPMLSNTVSGALLFIAGDAIEQKFEINAKLIPDYDGWRLARMFAVGISEGPTHVIFYSNLDKFFPNNTLKTVGKKVLTDQMIGCPLFNFQFFMGMSLLEGKDLKASWAEFRKKFPFCYLVDWLVWPPCQFINFLLVPQRYRILYVNGVTVAWNVFLSYMKHYDQHEDKQK